MLPMKQGGELILEGAIAHLHNMSQKNAIKFHRNLVAASVLVGCMSHHVIQTAICIISS